MRGRAPVERGPCGLKHIVCLAASIVYDSFVIMDCKPPGSYVHGILQARILDWVAISYSKGIFLIQGSNPSCLLDWQVDSLPLVPPGKPKIKYRTILEFQKTTLSR